MTWIYPDVAVSKDFKSANITTIKDLKQNMMTISEKVENLGEEINVKKKNQKEILQTKNINLRNYWIEVKKEIMNL